MSAGGAGLILRRLLHPFYRRLESDVRPLRYLFAEITRRCNLACRHCGSDCDQRALPGELGLEDWLDFFAYLSQNFDRKKLIVVLTGGEPLCHPQFGKIALALADHGLAWGMVTNGWAVTDQTARSLVRARVRSVTVSLDGGRDAHDWLRGRAGSHDRALAALERLVAARVPALDAVTCVNPRNLEELPRVLDDLRRVGLRQWRLFLIFPKGRARSNDELMLSADQTRRLIDWIAQTRRELRGQNFVLEFSCEGYFPAAIDRAIRNEPYFCRAGICIASVLADGAIAACPNIDRALVQGNIRTDDFKTVWEQKFLPFRDRSWMKTGPCADCRHFGRCQGNSLHLWDFDTGQTARCFHRLLEPGPK